MTAQRRVPRYLTPLSGMPRILTPEDMPAVVERPAIAPPPPSAPPGSDRLIDPFDGAVSAPPSALRAEDLVRSLQMETDRPPAVTSARPSFGQVFMRTAFLLAERSTCSRLQVGCVITSADHEDVLAVGYNGNARGLPNRCDRDEPGSCGCMHSEANAICKVRVGRDVPKVVYVTHLPCEACAKRIIQLGSVSAVYYAHDYRIRRGVELLEQASVRCSRFPLYEAGG